MTKRSKSVENCDPYFSKQELIILLSSLLGNSQGGVIIPDLIFELKSTDVENQIAR